MEFSVFLFSINGNYLLFLQTLNIYNPQSTYMMLYCFMNFEELYVCALNALYLCCYIERYFKVYTIYLNLNLQTL